MATPFFRRLAPAVGARGIARAVTVLAFGARFVACAPPAKVDARHAGGATEPDRDGDGVPDSIDHCPNVPGDPAKRPEHAGCACTLQGAAGIWSGETLHFAPGEAKLEAAPANVRALDEAARAIAELPGGRKVEVVGYSDPNEDQAMDWLARARAQVVTDALVARHVAAWRIMAEVGRGALGGTNDDKRVVVLRMTVEPTYEEACADW